MDPGRNPRRIAHKHMGLEMNGEVLDRTKDADLKDKTPVPGVAAGILAQINEGEID